MPPEPLPWDRKDLYRDRKHDFNSGGGGGGSGGGGGPRWRDSSSSYGGSRNNYNDFSPRWPFPSDFRRPPGHGKQGGWHMYPEDHPYQTPRSGDRFMDDDMFRSPGMRGDGRYGRFYRDNRPSFGQRDWRGHSWEGNHHHGSSANGVGRPHIANEQRSVGDSPMHASHPHSDSCDQFHLKDQLFKASDANGSGASEKGDKENMVGSHEWNPLKWSRSRSLTSRCSGFSHSSSSKSIGGESSDVKGDLAPKNVTPVHSPSGDAVPCVPSVAPPEEASSRKKARLGWGEGLAKYEKKKVDGPEDNLNRAGNATPVSNAEPEPSNSLASNLADKSPKVMGFSDCSSPATPSSFACSSSPGLDDKNYGKAIDVDGDASNFSVSSMPAPEYQPEQSHFSLEKLELNSIANLGSMLTELLQADDQCPLDNTGFMRTSALKKLLLWKGDISKALELTETEIDSLENELSSLKSCTAQSYDCPALSNSGSDRPNDAFNAFPRPQPLEIVSNGDIILEEGLMCDDTRVFQADSKDEDIDSPGTATSKCVDPPIQKSLSVEVCKNSSSGETSFVDFAPNANENLAVVVNEIDVGTCQIHDRDLGEGANNIATGIEHTSVCDKKEDNICDMILASNRESATRASEVLHKLLPSCDYIDANRVSCSSADSSVQDKFLKRKHFLKFKERVLSLKFRAFHHLWKEDLRLLSLRNHRLKTEKKLNLSSRSLQIGSHKHRSTIRSRFTSPAGNLSVVSMTEISSITGKLLSDSEVKVYRSSLKMPAMILDDKEKVSRFVSSNGLVEDPYAIEKERSLINPWTSEEKDIFMAKLAIHGKDFRKIASFLDHKTTADCVEFYYKNHKSECFEKIKKLEVNKQGKPLSSSTYLVTSGKKWSREMNAASLDILGAASVIAAEADLALETSKMLLGKSSNKKNRGSDGIIEASNSVYGVEDERETTAADVLAGICGSLSSEAMSSCITSSVDPGEGNQDWKHRKVGSSIKRPLTPEVTQSVDDGSCSDESCGEMDPSDWTDDEKSLFVRAFSSHGKDFLMISRCVGTKSRDQCKVFFSKARKCLGLDTLDQPRIAGINTSCDTNGRGESDTEDVGFVETGSIVCSDKSGSRLDGDVLNVNQDVSKPDALPELNILEENCWPGHLDHTDTDMADVSDPVDCNGAVDHLDKDSASAINARRSEEDGKSKMDSAIDASVAQDATHVSGVAMGREAGTGTSDSKSEMEAFSAPVDLSSYGFEFSKPLLTRDNAFNLQSGESPCSSKRFPLDLSIKAELHDVVTHSVGAESIIDHTFQGSFLRKCNRTMTPQNLVPELSFLQRSEGDTGSHSSKIEKPSCANGDVKLFGKILSKTSSVDKNCEEKAKHHSCSGGKFDMKLVAKQDSKGNPTYFSDDHNGFLGLENVPIRSYGFWDGTKIQTGFTSLPDSALLLAKYPAAFANYAISSPKSLQPPSQATTVNSNECNMNGACVFSPREFNSSNGGGSCIDYTVLRTQEIGHQPFRLDMKKQRPPDVTLSEVVPRTGSESVPSLPQQGKGLVKLNVLQGGDMIGVGSTCTTISDPVAALKLHYAGQQFGSGGSGQAVNGMKRVDSWHSQGDVGR